MLLVEPLDEGDLLAVVVDEARVLDERRCERPLLLHAQTGDDERSDLLAVYAVHVYGPVLRALDDSEDLAHELVGNGHAALFLRLALVRAAAGYVDPAYILADKGQVDGLRRDTYDRVQLQLVNEWRGDRLQIAATVYALADQPEL